MSGQVFTGTSPSARRRWHCALDAHCERFLGRCPSAKGEIVPGDPPLTLYPHLPSGRRPWLTLRTAGVSDRAMRGPDGRRYTELLLYLPASWELSGESFWPARLLKQIGRFPHQHRTHLAPNDTVAVSEPGESYAAGTNISGALLLEPCGESPEFDPLTLDGVACHFLWVVPLTEGEMDLKIQRGTKALLETFDKGHLGDPSCAALALHGYRSARPREAS